MSEDSVENKGQKGNDESPSKGRVKRKVRIKYRERVRIKRSEGNKTIRYWKKHNKNIIAATILIILLGYTIFMIIQVVREQVDMNYKEKANKSIGF